MIYSTRFFILLPANNIACSCANNTTDYSTRFSNAINQAYKLDTNGQAVALAGNLTSVGGTLTKSGAGTLTVSGNNSYDSGTTLSGGILALGSANAIGSAGTISFAGGTLQFGTNNSTDYSARFSTAASQAVSLDTNGQAVTLATGLTSSGGTLTKLGLGTLTLTGTNTAAGGTTISAGTLAVGAGGTVGTLAGNVVDNAQLVVNRSDAITLAGDISGTGSLTKQGGGTLTLTGNAGHSGGTTITTGALSVGAGGTAGTLTGNVVDNAQLVVNRSDAITLSGNIINVAGNNQNLAGAEVAGVDVQVNWSMDMGPGTIDASVVGGYLDQWTEETIPNVFRERAGFIANTGPLGSSVGPRPQAF